MEEGDKKLIEKLIGQNEELKKYVAEHISFEKKLDEYSKRPYLTSEEDLKRKKIQKLKLAGRDKLEEILAKYR